MAREVSTSRFPRRRHALLLTVVSGFAATLPAATLPAGDPLASAVEQELDEVIVRGTPLWRVRKAIVAAEDRFYALYNELNQQEEFDVGCRMEAPLGTRLRRRVCRIAFYEEAEAKFAQSRFTGAAEPEPELVFLERRDEYRRHALAVINSDRRLLRLVRERERLGRQLDAEYRKRFRKTRNDVEPPGR